MQTKTATREAAINAVVEFVHNRATQDRGHECSKVHHSDIPDHLRGPWARDDKVDFLGRWVNWAVVEGLLDRDKIKGFTRVWLTVKGLKLIDADVDATIHTDSDAVDVNTPRITAPEIFKKIGKNPKTILRAFVKAGIASILRAVLPREFRSFFVQTMVDGGVPMAMASKMMGHEDIRTTQGHYYALSADGRRVIGEGIPV